MFITDRNQWAFSLGTGESCAQTFKGVIHHSPLLGWKFHFLWPWPYWFKIPGSAADNRLIRKAVSLTNVWARTRILYLILAPGVDLLSPPHPSYPSSPSVLTVPPYGAAPFLSCEKGERKLLPISHLASSLQSLKHLSSIMQPRLQRNSFNSVEVLQLLNCDMWLPCRDLRTLILLTLECPLLLSDSDRTRVSSVPAWHLWRVFIVSP